MSLVDERPSRVWDSLTPEQHATLAKHERETCDHEYCGGCGPWCGGHEDELGPLDPAPDWPCSVVLAITGDADAEVFWKREDTELLAYYQAEHPEWFGDGTGVSTSTG